MTLNLRWTDLPGGIISSSIYAESDYLRMFADTGATLKVLEGLHEGQRFTLPLLIRHLEDGVYEGLSAYGYGGITALTPPSLPLNPDPIQAFLQKEGIIGIFLRHSPFLANQTWLPPTHSEYNRTCYTRNLRPGMDLDQFSQEVDQKLRWSINHARKAGLQVSFSQVDQLLQKDLLSFQELYTSLMKAKGTDASYLFSEEFFLDHMRFGPRCELGIIRSKTEEGLLAGALFLLDPESGWVHYHLSASHRDRLKSQPMELLLAEASVHFGNSGFRHFHLGGGHSADGQDGLSRFKRKFSSGTLPFYISKWTCDPIAYAKARSIKPLTNPSRFLISEARGQA